MTAAIQNELFAFATRLLERAGGVVEWPAPDQEGTALVPPETARLLHADDETVRLSCQPGSGGLAVSLATEFLDLASSVLEARVPQVACFRLAGRYLKRGDLEEAVARAYDWLNVRARVRHRREVSAEYHTWWFHASMRSEDVWETRFAVTLNSQSGAEVSLPDPLELTELEPCPASATDPPATYARAALVARERVKSLASGFLGRMESRLERDRRRLRDYYAALKRESTRKRPRAAQPPAPEEVEARNRAVDLELRRKTAELDERYAVEAVLRPIVLLRTELPVLAVDLDVRRKQAERVHTVYWNSLLKEFEPLACSRCGQSAMAVAFTNDDVAPLCPRCDQAPPRTVGTAGAGLRKAK